VSNITTSEDVTSVQTYTLYKFFFSYVFEYFVQRYMYSPSKIVLHKTYKAINHIQISVCMKMNQEIASFLVLTCFYINVGCIHFKQNNKKFVLKYACVLN